MSFRTHVRNLPFKLTHSMLDLLSQLKQFLAEGDCWAILPVSVANSLSNECEVKRVETIFDIPHREISILTSREDKKSVAEFCECIKEIIKDMPEVNPLFI